jgi:N-acetyl-anhydromuramyl-L-alanine amidase AmpD
MRNWDIMADKVAGHYVIGRSGQITSCVSEDYWSSHLGPGKRLTELNKRSIAIYLCNELYLQKDNSKYYAFGYVHPHNMYKGKVFEANLKGYKLWADYASGLTP